jgi:hypothetical protein
MGVTYLEIHSRKPYEGGVPFGEVGPYEQIDGVIHFVVDAAHLASTNARQYSEFLSSSIATVSCSTCRRCGSVSGGAPRWVRSSSTVFPAQGSCGLFPYRVTYRKRAIQDYS